MPPVRLEPATPQSRVKHSTTEPPGSYITNGDIPAYVHALNYLGKAYDYFCECTGLFISMNQAMLSRTCYQGLVIKDLLSRTCYQGLVISVNQAMLIILYVYTIYKYTCKETGSLKYKLLLRQHNGYTKI